MLPTLLTAAVCLIGSTGHAATNLVIDPGFEDPATASYGFTQYFGGQEMGSWQVLGNDILLLRSDHAEGAAPSLYFNAHSGVDAVDLSGDGNSGATDGVSQDIATVAGQAYEVAFYVGNQTGSGTFGQYYTQPSTVDFQIDGGDRVSFTNANTVANGIEWQGFATTFVATAPTTTIAFMNGTPVGDNYAGLDDVSIEPLPEASSWALMISGVFGVGAVLRRRADATKTRCALT